MDTRELNGRISLLLQKYRFPALVLLIGVFLMVFPGRRLSGPEKTEETVTAPIEQQAELEIRLTELLSQVEGAGKVRVLLTEQAGKDYVYQIDTMVDNSGTRENTVVISDSGRAQNGLLRQVNPPTYLGAVILCQGADSPTVQLAVTKAVSCATGLGFDRITVLKMK